MALPIRAKRSRYPAIEDRYQVFETLGAGGFAKVKAAVHKITGEKVAIKIMDKVQLGDDLPRAAREISILKRLHHQHICQLYEVVETDRMYFLVLEYCSGGELFDYIVAKERLKESEARSFFRQIVSAIRYIHSQGFCHRDLKPENLLLDENSNIKLIDFGLSAEPQHIEAPLGTLCGSPAYAAPELIKGGPYIGPEADAWSMGVLLYALLNGFLPFDDDHTPKLYDLIMKGVYDVPVWLSRDSIRLLGQLLQTDPTRRMKVFDLINHPWLLKTYDSKVDWDSRIDVSVINQDCVSVMSSFYGRPVKDIETRIKQWDYGPITSTYLILLKQKLSGIKPLIIAPPIGDAAKMNGNVEPQKATPPAPGSPTIKKKPSLKGISSPLEHATTSQPAQVKADTTTAPSANAPKNTAGTNKNGGSSGSVDPTSSGNEDEVEFPVPRRKKISLGMPIHPPEGEITNMILPNLSAPPPMNKRVAEVKGGIAVKPKDQIVPSPSLDTLSEEFEETMMTKSVDRGLDRIHRRKSMEYKYQAKDRSQSVQGGVNILSKIKGAFRRPSREQFMDEPRRVKGQFSVSTTSIKPADAVMQELLMILGNRKVTFKKKNYALRCQEVTSKGKTIQFELEICQFPDMDIVGIRRKRLKGDTWEFKKICEEIFSKARL